MRPTIAAALLSALLVACGGGDDGGEPPPPPPPDVTTADLTGGWLITLYDGPATRTEGVYCGGSMRIDSGEPQATAGEFWCAERVVFPLALTVSSPDVTIDLAASSGPIHVRATYDADGLNGPEISGTWWTDPASPHFFRALKFVWELP